MTDQKLNLALGASRLSGKLEGYRELVKMYLAMDKLDEYCANMCAYYMDRGIPPAIAAQSIRRALTPSNVKLRGAL